MTITRLAAIALLLLASAMPTLAQPTATVGEFIDGFLAASAAQCPTRSQAHKELERQGKMAEADRVKSAEVLICECVPNRMRQMRAQLSQQERAVKVTEAEFSGRYMPKAMAPFTAEGLRRTYADGCIARFAGTRPNTAAYCGCMGREVAIFTDMETFEIGRESAAHGPLAARAKQQGRPAPDWPPLMKRMADMDQQCARE